MGNVKETIESGKAVLGIEFGSTRIKAVLIDEKHTPVSYTHLDVYKRQEKSFDKKKEELELSYAAEDYADYVRQERSLAELKQYIDTVSYTHLIIDEVHMLSIGAFNALLKTLEEPPAYVIFILATTCLLYTS